MEIEKIKKLLKGMNINLNTRMGELIISSKYEALLERNDNRLLDLFGLLKNLQEKEGE